MQGYLSAHYLFFGVLVAWQGLVSDELLPELDSVVLPRKGWLGRLAAVSIFFMFLLMLLCDR